MDKKIDDFINKFKDDLISKLRKHTDLGHAKRDEAFFRQIQNACKSPGTSEPQAAGKAAEKIPMADLMSMYRFTDNEKACLADLRAARAKTVLDGVKKGADLLIIQDMSPLDYSGHNSKDDRRPIGNHKGMGYEYVANYAVDPAAGKPLGVIHDTVISVAGPDDQDMMDYNYEPLFEGFSEKDQKRLRDNHRHQMAVHVNGTASLLSDYHVIDVADREFDDIFILDSCKQNNRDFVIRSLADRNVQILRHDWLPESALTKKQGGHALAPGHVCVNFKRLIPHVPLQPYKSLPVNKHNRVVEASSAKRMANLSIGAFSIRLYRPAIRNGKRFLPPRPVELNVVVIRELDPPADAKALCWILFTSLPVDTFERMVYVGRIYELRWKIEDFFKLLKSGYRILYSRLDNAAKIARQLVVVTMAAMAILNLKGHLGLPSSGYLNADDHARIKQAMKELNNPDLDIKLRLFAFIAKNGGWLARKTDPIGPTILMRGMLHLLAVLDGVTRYAALIEEALKNPDALEELLGFEIK